MNQMYAVKVRNLEGRPDTVYYKADSAKEAMELARQDPEVSRVSSAHPAGKRGGK